MNQEDKELLLRDLCARLPYGVKVDIIYNKEHGSSDRLRICSEGCLTLNTDVLGLYIEDEIYLKPYLRPMSSMTEEEQKEFVSFHCVNLCPIVMNICLTIDNESKMLDWLNAHHFDYRLTPDRKTMIEAGLALEALEGMYK